MAEFSGQVYPPFQTLLSEPAVDFDDASSQKMYLVLGGIVVIALLLIAGFLGILVEYKKLGQKVEMKKSVTELSGPGLQQEKPWAKFLYCFSLTRSF